MEVIPFLRPAIAIALAEARHKAGLTQPQLADFSGLSRSYIAALEAGETSFSCESLYALLEVIHMDVVAFFNRVLYSEMSHAFRNISIKADDADN